MAKTPHFQASPLIRAERSNYATRMAGGLWGLAVNVFGLAATYPSIGTPMSAHTASGAPDGGQDAGAGVARFQNDQRVHCEVNVYLCNTANGGTARHWGNVDVDAAVRALERAAGPRSAGAATARSAEIVNGRGCYGPCGPGRRQTAGSVARGRARGGRESPNSPLSRGPHLHKRGDLPLWQFLARGLRSLVGRAATAMGVGRTGWPPATTPTTRSSRSVRPAS